MNAVTETAVVFLGANSIADLVLIAALALRPNNTVHQERPRAGVAADTTPATPAPVHPGPVTPARPPKPAVARSTENPGLARYAASRPRDPATSQFLPVHSETS